MIIGIIGGGQLGMMMAEEAKILNHKIISLDPSEECSIRKYSDKHIAKNYNDIAALHQMNVECDVITYEFENANLDALQQYAEKIPQRLEALKISRNRITEKNFAKDLGISTPKFAKVEKLDDIFFPCILKTVSGGYDGKGQYFLENIEDVDHDVDLLSESYICEEFIRFDYEISVIATRDHYNDIVFFPVPINTHKNGILYTSIVTEDFNPEIRKKAYDYTKKIIETLDYVGTLAVEFFVQGQEVIFNEFAPRPHNSGHYTMDGCNVSQFKNHILAITGEHVIQPMLLDNTIMINVLGQDKAFYNRAESMNWCHSHDYGKCSETVNRKIGHINCVLNNENTFESIMSIVTKEK